MARNPWRVEVVGPLEPFQPGFEARLAEMAYTPGSATNQLWAMKHLSIWLEERDLIAADVVPDVVQSFVADRRAEGYVRFPAQRALAPLLDYLRELGVIPVPAVPAATGPLPELMERYRRYLTVERGLDASTVRYYLHGARPFLTVWIDDSGSRLHELDAAAVTKYVLDECAHRSAGAAKKLVKTVRSLLRFLLLDGLLCVDLRRAVPTVAGWSGSQLPKAITPAEADALLAACDPPRCDPDRRCADQDARERARLGAPCVMARRDRAILLLQIRLGLRACEVAQLQLDDLDWRHGEVIIRGKGRRHERLPLPIDVGETIVDYLSHGRRVVATRAVFLRVCAPLTELTAGAVKAVVRRAARRAELSGVSAHRLRHGAATQLLRTGSSLTDVGQVLRHRNAATTAIYAKVDRDRLQALAAPWPGAGS